MTNYYLPEIELMLENIANNIIDENFILYSQTIFDFEKWLEIKKVNKLKNKDEVEIICDAFNSILSLDGLVSSENN